jgi:multidrug efflux pump subunit AcrB
MAGCWAYLLVNRSFALKLFFAVLAISLVLPFFVGSDFFPTTDTGLMKLHFRAPPGTRIEETEKLVGQAEDEIRKIIPAKELDTINSMIGVPTSYNLAFVPTDNVSGMDAELLIALKPHHHATEGYTKKIRNALNADFPGCAVYFQSADIVSQVLNFGLTSPVDVQVEFADIQKSFEIARTLRDKIRGVPGATDVTIKQIFDYPTLRMNVDRIRALQLGLTQRDVANSVLTSLSSSLTVAPSYFLNPVNNVNYSVAVKTPLQKLSSVQDLLATPVTPGAGPAASADSAFQLPQSQSQPLGNLGTMQTLTTFNQVSHNNVQRVVNVTVNVEGRDLGTVVRGINKVVKQLGPLPPGMRVTVRGQGEVMKEAFGKLGIGLILAIALVYLLMVILFQSWLDPFIVLVAVPGALIGILWILAITGTTINVTSYLGAIMAVGIASSNSILLVSFANEIRVEKHLNALQGALEAGTTRLRPVLMTALAMILGMLPTALGFGEGGEQNAPLGRAVIGGLFVATIVTLFIVPIVYSLLRTGEPTLHLLDERFKHEEEELPADGMAVTGPVS